MQWLAHFKVKAANFKSLLIILSLLPIAERYHEF